MRSRTLFSFFVPGGLLLVTAALLIQTNVLAPWLHPIARVAPWAVPAAGILLGWRFNRSRLVFAVLLLAIADRALVHFTQGTAALSPQGRLIFNIVALLLPVNLAILSLLKERGILTAHGIWRLCLILAQPLAVAAICHYQYFDVNAWLDYPIVKTSLLGQISLPALPQPALIAAMAAFLVAGVCAYARRGAIDNGFFWALPAVCFALAARKAGPVSTFYLCTAGVILVVSVIEASHVMAFRDELTGLPARRSLNELLLKLGNRYTVAMLDIDFFKKFNDTYGHDVGDQVLRMVASKISGVTGGGKAFRYGGEEFTVVFPGKGMDEIMPHLEQLRLTIRAAGFVVRGWNRPRKKPDKPRSGKSLRKKVSVTVSIGAAECNGRHADAQMVVKEADKALYRAKKAGRNRVST